MTASGYFCSVVWTPAGWRIVSGDWPELDRLLVYDIGGTLLHSQVIDGAGALNFLRAASAPDGTIAFVAQSLQNTMVRGLIGSGLDVMYEVTNWPAFGQCGINVGRINGEFVYYGMVNGFNYYEVVNGVKSPNLRNPFRDGTSQGWIDVFGGELRWIDQYREDPSQQLLFPTSQSGVTLGQNAYNEAGDYAAVINPAGQRCSAAGVLWQEPTIAVNPSGIEWAVCGRQLHGQIGFTALPPWVPVSDDVDPISDPPPPDPEPEPMPEPPDHSSVIRAVHDAFPRLLQTNTRDTCREFLWRCTWALHRTDARWGFLSKTDAENHVTIPGVGRVAIDAVTYRGWDGAVDIIANNSNPPEAGRPFWDVTVKRPSSVWVQPVPFPGSGPVEPPLPPLVDPPVPPVPQPPQPPPYTGPDYGEFLREAEAVAAAYRQRWGHDPGPTDMAHNDFRRLREDWSHEAIIESILED